MNPELPYNRYFIRFSFLGTAFHGWQIQPNGVTVQSVLEDALTKRLHEPVRLTGCGRTDAGVHASEFFAHFDSQLPIDTEKASKLRYNLNNFLPGSVVIHDIRKVNPAVHARFAALSRTYRYVITLEKDPFRTDQAWYYKYGALDIRKMNLGAAIIKEYTDFKCFSKKDTDIKGSDCLISHSQWTLEDGRFVYTVTANRFLRNMVRAIVGTLVEMGRGKWDERKLRQILDSGDRCQAGESVPACGLFLVEVKYPENIYLDG